MFELARFPKLVRGFFQANGFTITNEMKRGMIPVEATVVRFVFPNRADHGEYFKQSQLLIETLAPVFALEYFLKWAEEHRPSRSITIMEGLSKPVGSYYCEMGAPDTVFCRVFTAFDITSDRTTYVFEMIIKPEK